MVDLVPFAPWKGAPKLPLWGHWGGSVSEASLLHMQTRKPGRTYWPEADRLEVIVLQWLPLNPLVNQTSAQFFNNLPLSQFPTDS